MTTFSVYLNLSLNTMAYPGQVRNHFTQELNKYLDEIEPKLDLRLYSTQETETLKAKLIKADRYLEKARKGNNQEFLAAYARLAFCIAKGLYLSFIGMEGEKVFAREKLTLAKNLFAKARELMPDNVKYLVGQLEFSESYDKAGFEKLYEGANAQYPELADIHVIAGKYFADAGDNIRAADELAAAKARNPSCERLYEFFGERALEARNIQGAVENFEKVVSINPNNLSAHKILAESYVALTEQEKAINALMKILEINPGNFDAQIKLGDLYLAQGDHDNAIKAYEIVIGTLPQRGNEKLLANIQINAAYAYSALYNSQKIDDYLKIAEKHLKGALILDPRNPTVNYDLACLFSIKGNMEQADKYLRIAFKRAEKNGVADLIETYRHDEDLAGFRDSKFAPIFEEQVIKPLLEDDGDKLKFDGVTVAT